MAAELHILPGGSPRAEPVHPPPGWTFVELPTGRWSARRQYIPGERAGASLESESYTDAVQAAVAFEGARR